MWSICRISSNMYLGETCSKAETVNHRPVLSSESALQNNKPQLSKRKSQGERKIGRGSQMGAWHQDGLADWLSVVMWLWFDLSLLTFDSNFGLDHPVHGGYGWGDLGLQVGEVSDETVIYEYGYCATLTGAWFHCKLLTRPQVREDALLEEERK
jgi:hypothetical protein